MTQKAIFYIQIANEQRFHSNNFIKVQQFAKSKIQYYQQFRFELTMAISIVRCEKMITSKQLNCLTDFIKNLLKRKI